MPTASTFLWLSENRVAEAARFYAEVFKDPSIAANVEPGTMSHNIKILGQNVILFHGGPYEKLTSAFSILIDVETQEEVDYYYDSLRAFGGTETHCGWLTDQFGVTWQVIPNCIPKILGGEDRARADRAMQKMLQMKKIIISDFVNA
eukprot:PhF_6_TR39085/c0_g1_i2/m.58494